MTLVRRPPRVSTHLVSPFASFSLFFVHIRLLLLVLFVRRERMTCE